MPLLTTAESGLTDARSRAVARKLTNWFPSVARALPWRDNPTPYRVWISEVMLQQTTATACIPFFERFTATLPTLQSLASASEDQVFALWAGLGYYTRARNLHRTAKLLIANSSQFPQDVAQLTKLPGIGSYTAGAILSIAFNKPSSIVDANIRRVLGRILAIPPEQPRAESTIALASLSTSRSGEPRIISQALMELGALVCKLGLPDCVSCPVQTECQSRLTGRYNFYGSIRRASSSTLLSEVCTLLRVGDAWLISRPTDGRWTGLWEFPRSKSDASPMDSAHRLLKSRFGLQPSHLKYVGKLKHTVTRYNITLHIIAGKTSANAILPGDWRLVGLDELQTLAMPSPMRRIADRYIIKAEELQL